MPLPTLPSPRTWASRDLVTVPRLRADVADAVAFLSARPYFVGQNTAGSSIATNTNTALGIDVQLTDAWNGWVPNPGGFSSQYWAPVPGWYLARSTVTFSSGTQITGGFNWTTGGTLTSGIFGAVVSNSTSLQLTAQCCDLIEQTASGPANGSGDYIQPICAQNSGSSLALAAGSGTGAPAPTVSVRWVCATSGTHPLPVPPLAAVPSPITSAWLNANVRDAIRFLIYPPVLKAHYTAGSATLPTGTLASPSPVPCGTADVDNYGGYNASTFTYTAPVAGRYTLYGQINMAGSATSNYYACGLSVNGSVQWGDIAGFAPSASQAGGASVSRRLRLSAGDTVKLVAVQANVASLAYNTAAGNQTRFIAVWDGI